MGHCGNFGDALWATALNLVYCSGFGYALWATAWNKAVQYKSVTISALWAIAHDFGMHYEPWHRLWLCTMGHSAKPITMAHTLPNLLKAV
jgi:hypothetical protein